MPRLLNVLGFGLLALGSAVLVAAAMRDGPGVSILADSPWTVGGNVGAVVLGVLPAGLYWAFGQRNA